MRELKDYKVHMQAMYKGKREACTIRHTFDIGVYHLEQHKSPGQY